MSRLWRALVLLSGGGVLFVLGAQEGVYSVPAAALGAPAAAGLTLALARRLLGVLVAFAGLTVIRIVPQDNAPSSERA